jgi:catechol 2,3-dioxygenase-like lactoylglutathione lyase family enzyme
VLDAELIGGPPYVDGAYVDESLVDEGLVDERLLDEGLVDDSDETFVDEILLDELLVGGPPVEEALEEPLVEEAPIPHGPIHEPPLAPPVAPPLAPPIIPQPRTEPPAEALVGEVVIDTSRVGEAARGIGMMLIVSDLGLSLRFYRDILGLQAVDVTDRTAELTFGGGRLLLCLVADMSPVNRRVEHLHLDVPDVEAAYHDLRAKGVVFPHPPRVITTRADGSELLAATFRDPDGHAVALTQWRERADDLI